MEINSSIKANGHSNGNGHSHTNDLDPKAISKIKDQVIFYLNFLLQCLKQYKKNLFCCKFLYLIIIAYLAIST